MSILHEMFVERQSEVRAIEIDLLNVEVERLRKALEQIAIVCTANMDRDRDHRMALDAVRQVANDAFEQNASKPDG